MDLARAFDLDDNYVVVSFDKMSIPNVKVEISAPAAVPWQPSGYYEVTLQITNESSLPLEVPVRVWVDAQAAVDQDLGEFRVAAPPNKTVSVTRQIDTIRCKDVYFNRVELNPGGTAFEETSMDDNRAASMTIILNCGQERIPTFTGGVGKTFIVPFDCDTTTVSEGRVCKGDGPTYDSWWD